MTRDDLGAIFRDPAGLLARAGVYQSVNDGGAKDQPAPKVSAEDLNTFLASINLDRDGILATRDRIVAFLGLTVDQDDPVFGLPATIPINDGGEIVDVYERLILSVQPRSRTTETRQWVQPTKYSAEYLHVSHNTTYWDDIWFRLLFRRDSAEHKFQWDCSQCRPGHRLIALFRKENRAGLVNVDTKTYWVDHASLGAAMVSLYILAVIFSALLGTSLGAISNKGAGFALFLTCTSMAVWFANKQVSLLKHDVARICSRLLGCEVKERKKQWIAASVTGLCAIWTVMMIIPSTPQKVAPTKNATSPAKKPAQQADAPKAKKSAEAPKNVPAVVRPGTPALPNPVMQWGYDNIKAGCTRDGVKQQIVSCVNKTLEMLLRREWGKDWSDSDRDELIKGARIFLAEVQARPE